ncbi:hypothetical protein [Mariprofundus ferrooxydans]|uniref:Uncharacterized protein n=1 Tax=Mariprofundus ferrooxydans PV-1 TaxID=314345 RepID=Q0EXE8_9PROT|nr:hypothetical protein [Mariprofundus ferrooxydans]EAU53968.1 hypothetical protein SPV1_13257 [Mariprofundus ferrooxydans PV-1]KON47085.1 hypothetical protein AL013_09755 [Mariprofundus ferrooxydans]
MPVKQATSQNIDGMSDPALVPAGCPLRQKSKAFKAASRAVPGISTILAPIMLTVKQAFVALAL